MILLPLILLGGGGGGYLAYSQYVSLAAMGHDSEAVQQMASTVEYGDFMELDNLIVNPAGTDGQRYLMVKLGLESNEPKALEEVTSKKVVVRDRVLKILSSQTVEQLSSIQARDTLKEDLLRSVNEILQKGKITRLYFTQYVLQ